MVATVAEDYSTGALALVSLEDGAVRDQVLTKELAFDVGIGEDRVAVFKVDRLFDRVAVQIENSGD